MDSSQHCPVNCLLYSLAFPRLIKSDSGSVFGTVGQIVLALIVTFVLGLLEAKFVKVEN